MLYTFRIPLILGFLLFLGTSTGFSQVEEARGLKQVFEIQLDELGNATISFTSKLNASQWAVYQQNLGGNSASLKREIVKSMPKYHLSDFEYSEESLERTFTLKMKATAVSSLTRQGRWKAELDGKDPDIMQVNDRQFRLDVNYISEGQLLDQSTYIHLPKGVKDAKIEKDSFGNAILTYRLKNPSSSPILPALGGLFIIGGGLVWWKGKKKE